MKTDKIKNIDQLVFNFDYKKVEDVCDFGIVFGGLTMVPQRMDKALELYQEGLIKKLILSGGIGYFNIDKRIPEALKMYDYALNKGVKESDLILETNSRNSMENIKYSLNIIKSFNDFDKVKLGLITSQFHLKRVLLLFQKYVNNMDNIYAEGVKDGIFDRENWFDSKFAQKVILKEAITLYYYNKLGIIKDEQLNLVRKKD